MSASYDEVLSVELMIVQDASGTLGRWKLTSLKEAPSFTIITRTSFCFELKFPQKHLILHIKIHLHDSQMLYGNYYSLARNCVGQQGS